MLVILDTNVIVGDFRLTAASSRLLIENLKQAGHELAVPELVVQEAVNKFREQLTDDAKSMVKLTHSVSQKLGQRITPCLHPIYIAKHVTEYDQFLRNKLREHGASTPPLPDVSHQEVIRRALDRRKPFSADGRQGYRDTLIWETIRGLVKEIDGKIAFISLNKHDFAGDNGELHKELKADLAADGPPEDYGSLFLRELQAVNLVDDDLPEDKVRLFLRVDQFLDKCVIPNLPLAEQAIAKLTQFAPKGCSLPEVIAEALSEPLYGTEISAECLGKLSEIENPSIYSVGNVSELEFSHKTELSKSEAVLKMTATVDCEFMGFLFKSDYWLLYEEDAPSVLDADWNKYYYAVSFMAQVSVEAYLTVALDKGVITDVEVLGVDGIIH